MTLADAYEYVDRALEAEGEQRAEYGMGAVSMGFDPYDAMGAFDGYRAASDPDFCRARELLANADAIHRARKRRHAPVFVASADDIPF